MAQFFSFAVNDVPTAFEREALNVQDYEAFQF